MAGPSVFTFLSGLLLTFTVTSWAMRCTQIFKNLEGDMPPDFNVLEGSPFEISCSITLGNATFGNKTFEVDGSFLEFKFNNKVLPEDQIERNISSITYRKSVMTLADNGTYYCNLRFPRKRLFHICATQVGVGTLPPPVKNFRCISYHLKSLNCSWELPKTTITTYYTLYDSFAGLSLRSGFPRVCPIVSADKTSCSWALSSRPPFRKETRDFVLVMVGNNSLGNESWTYRYHHFSILKVSEPTDFACSAVTRHSVTLSWTYPEESSEITELPIVSRILYKSEYENQWKDYETSKNSTMIQNLHPFTNYTFLLASKSANASDDDMWSGNVTLSWKTLEDVPERPPMISPSGYMVQNFKSKRSIILNFESLSRVYWAGATLNYIIQCCEISSPRSCFNKTSEDPTVTVDGLQQNVSYEFKIWAQNENGVSRSHSTIQIDRYDELLAVPENLAVTALSPTDYQISWKPLSDVEDDVTYTLFWCPRMVPRSNSCNGTLRWLTTNETSEILKLERDHLYQFGVAANSSDQTSGMVWTTCIIPVSGELEKITQVTLEKAGTHSLLMRWQVECGVEKKNIESYQIELCEVSNEYRKSALHDSSGCQQAHYKPSECHIYNVSDSTYEEYILDDLKPRTTYRGAIRIFSRGSFTVDSPVQCAVTDAVGPVVSMIVGIAVGGALGLTLLVFVLYRMAVWVKQKSDMIKEMKVQLPDALHSSEENQLQSYKGSQNGAVRKASDTNGSPRSIYGRSFGTDGGGNKQRHNSGHSEGSSSSTDELLYKNVRRADALGRNPSGDSSGGSCHGHDSLTSVGTARTQASSCDSGAESDANAPPSPDSVFGNHTPLARVRPLPKLDENEDRDSQDSGLDAGPSQQAYSKIGVIPEPPNQLASQLLANSEPSLFDIDSTEAAVVEPAPEVASYSKFGLAKSAGNISGLDGSPVPFSVSQPQPPPQDTPSAMPYSRLGLRHQRPGGAKPYGGTDVTVGMVLEQPRVLPHIKDVAAPLNMKPPAGYVAVGQALKSPVAPESGQGYSKFSIQPAPPAPSATSGYVPLEAVVAGGGRLPAAPPVQQELLETAKSSKTDSDESPESVSTSDDAAIAGGENSNASLDDFSFSSLSAPSNEETLSEQPATNGVQSASQPPSSSGYVSASSLPASDHRSEPPGQPPVQCAPPTANGYVPALSVPKDSHPVVNGVRDEYVSHNAAFEWARPSSSDQCKPWTAGASEGKPCTVTNGYVALSAVTEPPSTRTPSIAVHVNAGSPQSSQHVDCSV